jgi:hypothetical protein
MSTGLLIVKGALDLDYIIMQRQERLPLSRPLWPAVVTNIGSKLRFDEHGNDLPLAFVQRF